MYQHLNCLTYLIFYLFILFLLFNIFISLLFIIIIHLCFILFIFTLSFKLTPFPHFLFTTIRTFWTPKIRFTFVVTTILLSKLISHISFLCPSPVCSFLLSLLSFSSVISDWSSLPLYSSSPPSDWLSYSSLSYSSSLSSLLFHLYFND